MKILIYSQYFHPETNAPANRLNDMARYLSEGNTVSVLTGFPNHPLGKMMGDYKMKWLMKEKIQGIDVYRSFLIIPKKTNSKIYRYLNYFSFAFSSFFNLFRIEKPDLMIATSPPISVLILGYIYAKARNIPLIIDLRDLWPEAAVSLKVVKKGLLTNCLEWLVTKAYKYSKNIIINTEAFRDVLVEKYMILNSKITYIPNGFDVEGNMEFKKEFVDEGEFKIFYSGLFGWAQNVDLIVETARVFKDRGSLVKFVLIGDGPLKSALKDKISKYHLNNLEIFDYQKKESLFNLISGCNLGLITYELNDTFRKNIPSKIFDYMFLEKPVLINLEGEASKMVEAGNFGFCYETNDPVGLCNRIEEILINANLRIKGNNGFKYLKANFDKKELLKRLNKILEVE